ncbi:hypothetical protein [Kitasatospora sp. NPDC059571]|uniref:hypothetical protein n=1 Tax=Kitasatospora sp. NPDC059571 TaxID=3346871 RepID=UPI0036B6F108
MTAAALLALLLGGAPSALLDLPAAGVGVQVVVHHEVALADLRALRAGVPGRVPQPGRHELSDLRGGAVLGGDRSGDHAVGQVGAGVGTAADPQPEGRVPRREGLEVVVGAVSNSEP